MSSPTDQPTTHSTGKPYRSESFWLAVWVSVIHLVLLAILAVVAWRSPFMLMRLPERIEVSPPRQPAHAPAVHPPETGGKVL